MEYKWLTIEEAHKLQKEYGFNEIGAPQVIISMCNNNGTNIEETVEKFASVGKRSLGVAIKKDNKVMFVELLTFFDFPGEDSKKFIEKIKEMGVTPKMITGDKKLIAESIAKEVDIGENVVSIKEVSESKNIDIDSIDAFAEVVRRQI